MGKSSTLPHKARLNSVAGFTLIEVLITAIIAGIIAMIAIPSYRVYVVQSNRAVASSTAEALVTQQEERKLATGSYATDLEGLLGTKKSTVFIDKKGEIYDNDKTISAIYSLSFGASPTATTYSLLFKPVGSQSSDDECALMTINHRGEWAATDAASKDTTTACWER